MPSSSCSCFRTRASSFLHSRSRHNTVNTAGEPQAATRSARCETAANGNNSKSIRARLVQYTYMYHIMAIANIKWSCTCTSGCWYTAPGRLPGSAGWRRADFRIVGWRSSTDQLMTSHCCQSTARGQRSCRGTGPETRSRRPCETCSYIHVPCNACTVHIDYPYTI